MGYIYMLKSPSGKIYIGHTTRPIEKRIEQHQKSNRCRALYNAIKFHGWGNFEKDWYKCPDEDLNFDEELLVREIGTLSPNGYNLREGGGSSGKASEESKKKMRESQLGKKQGEKTKQKKREANLGEKNPNFEKPPSKETRKKISKSLLGKKDSEETKQKKREAHLGEKNHMFGKTGENIHNSKRVYQYDLDGTFINSFESGGEAGRHLEKSARSINRCACGERKTAYGFKWSHTLNIFM